MCPEPGEAPLDYQAGNPVSSRSPLEFVAIDLFWPPFTTRRGNKFLLVITARFSKIVRTVPLTSITAFAVAHAFVTHMTFAYSSYIVVLSDNGKQFAFRVFKDVCRIQDVKNLVTTTYHPQINVPVKRFNCAFLASLRAYVADHPLTWELYTDALTYAFNTQVHRTTRLMPFELVCSRSPPPVAMQSHQTTGSSSSVSQYRLK